MSLKPQNVHENEALNLESGLEALKSSPEFQGPVESLDGHDSNDHLALIYETQEEQFAAAIPFIRQGLERGEQCLYIADDNSKVEVLEAMRSHGVDVDAAMESGALLVETKQNTYLRNGTFDPDEMIEFLTESIENSLDEFSGLRIAGEMTWIFSDEPKVEDLIEYEGKLNRLFPGEDSIALCQYNRERFPPEIIRDVVRTHPHIIYDNTVCHNFYFTPPEEFFGPDRPEAEVDRMMRTMIDRTEAKATLQERERFQREFNAITSNTDLTFDEQLERLLELGRERLDLGVGLLTHKEGEKFRVVAASGAPAVEPGTTVVDPLPQQYCRKTVTLERPLAVEDAKAAGWDDDPLYQEYGLGCYLGVKVTAGNEVYGTLVFAESEAQKESFGDAELAFLEMMKQWVDQELAREERVNYLRKQNEITANPHNTFEEKLQRLFELGCEQFDLELGAMARVDPETDRFEIEYVSDDHEYFEPGVELPLSETYCTAATDGGGAASVSNPHEGGYENITVHREFGLQSYIGTYVEVDGDANRTFFFVSSEPRDEAFSDEEHTYQRLMGQWVQYELEQQNREQFQRTLYEIAADSNKPFEEKLQRLFELGCERFDLELGAMARVNPETDLFEIEHLSDDHEHFEEGLELPLSQTYCTAATDNDGIGYVTNPFGTEYENIKVHREFGLHSYLGTCIEVEGGFDRTFFFVSSDPHKTEFSENERTFHELMGQWVQHELEQRNREQELRESKEYMSALVETTPECIKTVATDGTLLQMNSAGLDMVQAESASDVVGGNVYDLIAPEDREKFREFNERICDGESGTLEFDIIGREGRRLHMESHAVPLERPDGTTAQVALTRNITAQRELYETTSDSNLAFEEKLDQIFELGCEKFGLELGGVARIDPEENLFEVEHVSGEHDQLVPGARVDLSDTYCRIVADEDQTTGVTDPVDSGFEDTLAYDEFGVQAYLGTRLDIETGLDRTFFFVSNEPRDAGFTDEEQTFHHLMGQWVEYELEREHREDQLAGLNEMSRNLMGAETQEEIAEVTVEHAQTALKLPVTALVYYDREAGELSPAIQTPCAEDDLPTSTLCESKSGPLWEAFVTNEVRVLDVGVDIELPDSDLSQIVTVPLGKQGLVVTATTTTSGFSDPQFDFIRATAATIENAFDRADRERLLHEREQTLEEQNETLEHLNRVNDIVRSIDKALVQASTRAEIESVICEQLAGVGLYDLAWIGDHDAVTDEITPREWAGTDRGYLNELAANATGSLEEQGPTGLAVETREPRVSNSLLDDAPFEPWRQAALNRGFHSNIALPLVYEGSLYGVLSVYASEPEAFGELEQAVLAELGDTIAYAINAVESKKALVSDEVSELEFTINDLELDVVKLVQETGCEFNHESLVPRSDGSLRAFFSTRGAPAEDVLEFGPRLPTTNLELISEREEDGEQTCLFEATLTDESLPSTVLEHGGKVREIRAVGENAKVTIHLAADAAVREFVEMLQSKYPQSKLVAQRTRESPRRTPTEFHAVLTDELTPRQLESLQTAYFSGYYEKPRRRTGSEVAETMEISQPTFNSHLRAAQRKLCRQLFEGEPLQV